VDVSIMIEAQNGLNWDRWRRLAPVVEHAGFHGLYRSDHFTNASPPDHAALELWVSLTWLAENTSRIRFGPLVTPVSIRDPVMTARMAKDLDALAEGRVVLGLGAGWQVREHQMFGYDLRIGRGRFDRFAEGLQIVDGLLRENGPVSYEGEYYRLQDARLLPPPRGGKSPLVLVGGNGVHRTLPLAARFADAWNGIFLTAGGFAMLSARLDELAAVEDRGKRSIRRTLMTGLVFGIDAAELASRLGDRDADTLRGRGIVVGTGDQVRPQLEALAAAGVQELMLQWLDLDDTDGLVALGEAVLGT